MRTAPLWAGPKILGPAAHCMATMGGANHHKHNPHKLHDLPVLKRDPLPVRMYGSMYWGGGGGKVCFEGEAMGLMVLHGWRG